MTSMANEIDDAKNAAQRERSNRTLAENAKWLNEHRDQTVHAAHSGGQPAPTGVAPKAEALADAGQSQK